LLDIIRYTDRYKQNQNKGDSAEIWEPGIHTHSLQITVYFPRVLARIVRFVIFEKNNHKESVVSDLWKAKN